MLTEALSRAMMSGILWNP